MSGGRQMGNLHDCDDMFVRCGAQIPSRLRETLWQTPDILPIVQRVFRQACQLSFSRREARLPWRYDVTVPHMEVTLETIPCLCRVAPLNVVGLVSLKTHRAKQKDRSRERPSGKTASDILNGYGRRPAAGLPWPGSAGQKRIAGHRTCRQASRPGPALPQPP